MKNNSIVKSALSVYNENELIIAGKLYREELSQYITEAAYYKTLQRMCESGELVKIAKGTYHLPKKTKYGIIPPSEKEIVSAFTKNKTGTVVGYSLYNELNLTTQISKAITVFSSVIDGGEKSVRNITVYQMPLEFSKEITNIIHSLDVLQNFDKIQDINYSAFLKFTKEFSESFNGEAFEKIISVKKYKKSTISFMREILNYYNVQNNLSKHLSSLSTYKHPKMEELYAATRIHQ
ncbi:MAG: DUF6088 family protein [Acutalibacteraceae bacterium]